MQENPTVKLRTIKDKFGIDWSITTISWFLRNAGFRKEKRNLERLLQTTNSTIREVVGDRMKHIINLLNKRE